MRVYVSAKWADKISERWCFETNVDSFEDAVNLILIREYTVNSDDYRFPLTEEQEFVISLHGLETEDCWWVEDGEVSEFLGLKEISPPKCYELKYEIGFKFDNIEYDFYSEVK